MKRAGSGGGPGSLCAACPTGSTDGREAAQLRQQSHLSLFKSFGFIVRKHHRNMQIRARRNAFAGPRVFSKSCLLFRKSPKQLASLNCRTSKHKDVK